MGIFGQGGDFELDLSHFEEKQRKRLVEQANLSPLDDEIDLDLGDVPTPSAPWDDQRAFEDLYSEESIWKASLLIKGEHVHKVREHIYNVDGSQTYTVTVLESDGLQVPWLMCSCPNGEARGGRPSCYHASAVHAVMLGIDISDTPKPEKKRPARS